MYSHRGSRSFREKQILAQGHELKPAEGLSYVWVNFPAPARDTSPWTAWEGFIIQRPLVAFLSWMVFPSQKHPSLFLLLQLK